MDWEDEQKSQSVSAARVIAKALDRLGNADAATPMGALEAHGKYMGEVFSEMSAAILESIVMEILEI